MTFQNYGAVCCTALEEVSLSCPMIPVFCSGFNYSCFTMLCSFLLYSKVNQSHVYIHSFLDFLPI